MPEIKRPLKVFLYHAPIDRGDVRDLYLRLIKDGVDARLVKEKLLPGQDWKREIHEAMREADVVIACLSERFDREEFRKKDMRAAFDTAIEQFEGETLIIPARLDECDRLEHLGRWQWVDLFESAGYETLMSALQARAAQVGAAIQRKDGSLPEIASPGRKREQPLPAENPAEAMQEMPEVLIEGPGILIEGPAVKLQGSTPQRRSRRTLIAALISLAGIFVAAAVLGPSRLDRLYQLALTSLLETTRKSGSATGAPANPVAKADHANIVFLIDTSGSMQGQRIVRVKSVVSEFVSQLDNRYPISVIQFDTNVELQVGLTHDHAGASQAIRSITVDGTNHGSCVYDALYAGIQQSSLIPTTKDAKNIIIILTNLAIYGIDRDDCKARFLEDVANLPAKYPVSIFVLHVDDQSVESGYKKVDAQTGMTFFIAATESEIESTLLSISEAALLSKTESKTVVDSQIETVGVKHVPMVFVPPGEFRMGNNTVTLDAFWIDKTEVTNAMYAECVQADRCSTPHSYRSKMRDSYYGNGLFADYPVINVSWTDANNYCAWTGGHLPTEAEWEKAARGTDGRRFPWGNDDPWGFGGLLNYQGQDTSQVGSFPGGASPYGALDMAGNVAEWVSDWLSVDYYNNPPASNPMGPASGQYRVWRGGSWAHTSVESLLTYTRSGNLPTDYSSVLGFRCARDVAP